MNDPTNALNGIVLNEILKELKKITALLNQIAGRQVSGEDYSKEGAILEFLYYHKEGTTTKIREFLEEKGLITNEYNNWRTHGLLKKMKEDGTVDDVGDKTKKKNETKWVLTEKERKLYTQNLS